MMGMFRMQMPGRPTMYEFLLIEETPEGATMRLRHYGPGMADIDRTPFRLKLASANDRRLEFVAVESDTLKRIVYERDGAAGLVVQVETTRSGRPAKFTLNMTRAGAK
jgi:hypothetical protein